MKYLAYIVAVLISLRFIADNCYEATSRNLMNQKGYEAVRLIETAGVLNPTSILIAQLERRIIPGALPGKRLVFFHPNDYDALIIRVDELRNRGEKQEARKMLFRAAKADPYSSVGRYEAQQLK